MQSTPENPQPQQNSAQKKKADLQHIIKLRSPIIGYIAAFAFVGGLLGIERLDALVPQAPLFLGAPFGLLAILVALLWGIGPALVTLLLSLIVLAKFISPGIFTFDVLRDIIIMAPFIGLEIVAIAAVIYLEQARRSLLMVHRELEEEHANVLQSNKQLEQANALKDYVLTRAAHEFRTPLTTILGRTQLLASRLEKSGKTPENWHAIEKYIGIVEVRALHLRSLIDSLFELSRVQSEKLSSPLPSRDLKSLCLDVIEEVSMQTERVIEFDFPANAIVLPADDKRLFQALANILSNAAKYSEIGTSINVQVSSNSENVTLQIHNTCPTPDPEQLEQLFQPFYRTPDVQYSSIHGWGLGLTISKEIVERHKGKIWAESPEGKGLSVFVQLPLHAEQA
jgi:signal transduction histidine kinase